MMTNRRTPKRRTPGRRQTDRSLGPCTMKLLYQLVTGDRTAHQRSIDAHVRKMDARRRRILRRRTQGANLKQIAREEGCTHGSIQSVINRSMRAVRKAIAGEPRYAHGHPGRYGSKPQPEA